MWYLFFIILPVFGKTWIREFGVWQKESERKRIWKMSSRLPACIIDVGTGYAQIHYYVYDIFFFSGPNNEDPDLLQNFLYFSTFYIICSVLSDSEWLIDKTGLLC